MAGEVRPLDEGGVGRPVGSHDSGTKRAWSDSWGKIFRAKKTRKVSHHWESGLGTGLVSTLEINNKALQVVFLPSDWRPLWSSTNTYWFCFHFGFYQVYNPTAPIRLFLLAAAVLLVWTCLVIACFTVWLSHNKTAPALDTVRICSNWYQTRYEIIWRRLWLIRDFMAYHLCC